MTDDIENNKIMGHLFYTTSSSVHHFKAIGEFKLELQSGNAQFGLKSAIFPLWPWNLTDDLEKQQNNEAPLLYYVKLCASFQSHQWIQTGVTVRKRSIRDKIGDFFVPCDLQIRWMTSKTIKYLFYTTLGFVLELQSGNSSPNRWFFLPCDLEIS